MMEKIFCETNGKSKKMETPKIELKTETNNYRKRDKVKEEAAERREEKGRREKGNQGKTLERREGWERWKRNKKTKNYKS